MNPPISIRQSHAGRPPNQRHGTGRRPRSVLDEAAAMFEALGKPNDHCKVLITP